MTPDSATAGAATALQARCCVVGGGPAGMILGLLLARAGVDVLVLEKHKDFFRDFRGDTIHPSTLELMHELGLLEEFLAQPHAELRQIVAHFQEQSVHIADFTHLPTQCKFIAFMPQWDFLNFVAREAGKYPAFRLQMETEVTDLLFDGDRIVGVQTQGAHGSRTVHADLVIGADGRTSTVRARAGFEVIDVGAPMDVLWFRVQKSADDPPHAFGYVGVGQFMVLLDRGDYYQCAYFIRKGSLEDRKARGLDAFRSEIVRCAAFLADRVAEIKDWDDVKLLSVKVDHLRRWYRDGLLCIGDSAHAMSPMGGVGVNLAVQDAVATANLLTPVLRQGRPTLHDLKAVQDRRESPARKTQDVQVFLHKHFLEHVFDSKEEVAPPLATRMFEQFPLLRRLPARVIGLGFRPEHIRPV